MVIKHTNNYHTKDLQNSPKFAIFGLKTNHLATRADYLLKFYCSGKFEKVASAEMNFSHRRIRMRRVKILLRLFFEWPFVRMTVCSNDRLFEWPFVRNFRKLRIQMRRVKIFQRLFFEWTFVRTTVLS
jgi:hypothetical protein